MDILWFQFFISILIIFFCMYTISINTNEATSTLFLTIMTTITGIWLPSPISQTKIMI